MASNPLIARSLSVTSPALGSIVVAPDDDTDLATGIRAITIGTAGTVAWISRYGSPHETAELPAGTYPLFATRILATGTTATQITGWI